MLRREPGAPGSAQQRFTALRLTLRGCERRADPYGHPVADHQPGALGRAHERVSVTFAVDVAVADA